MNRTFTLDHDALFDVSQFISCLYNKLISENDSFAKTIGFDPVTFDSYKNIVRCCHWLSNAVMAETGAKKEGKSVKV